MKSVSNDERREQGAKPRILYVTPTLRTSLKRISKALGVTWADAIEWCVQAVHPDRVLAAQTDAPDPRTVAAVVFWLSWLMRSAPEGVSPAHILSDAVQALRSGEWLDGLAKARAARDSPADAPLDLGSTRRKAKLANPHPPSLGARIAAAGDRNARHLASGQRQHPDRELRALGVDQPTKQGRHG